jgi:hypothetical protein
MNDLIGKKVVVFSNAGQTERQDIGTLESVDSTWLKLKKGTEILIFCVYNVRIVKQFDS